MRVEAFGKTDVGKVRDHNEDYLLVRKDLGLYVVCDGMGGHAAGEVASEESTRSIEAYIESNRAVLENFRDTKEGRQSLVQLVRRAIQEASASVYRLATEESGRAGMGTTCILLLVVRGKAIMGHVGDSRLYLRRGDVFEQLSTDHSYLNEMLRNGSMTQAEIEEFPYANALTRAVGIQESVKVDTLLFDLLPNDRLLLCSDGLSGYMEGADEEPVVELMGESGLSDETPGRMIEHALARGGRDNITAVLLVAAEWPDVTGEIQARADELELRTETLRYISLFSTLSMAEMSHVLGAFQVVSYKPDDNVIHEGTMGGSLFVILEGEVQIARGDVQIAILSKGNHFGEMSLLSAEPRSATVTAACDTRLMVINRQDLLNLFHKEPQIGVKFLWTLAQVLSVRLSDACQLLDDPQKTVKLRVPL
jgi:PPM family protein phosphatase